MFTPTARRASVLTGALLMSAFAIGSAAHADTEIGMEADEDSVEIEIELNEEQPGSSGGGGGTDETGSSSSVAAEPDSCEYITVNPDLAPAGIGERPSADHVLVARACRGDDAGSVTDFQWVEADEVGNLAIDPEVLAAEAVDSLHLPTPQIETNPDGFQLVHSQRGCGWRAIRGRRRRPAHRYREQQ